MAQDGLKLLTMKKNNFTIKTLGCKVNQSESDAICQQMKNMEWFQTLLDEKARICIINTCTVTQKASMQSRQAIRKAIKSNPKACIIVTGCYAQTEPDEIKKIEGVDYIVGNTDKHNIPEIITPSANNVCSKFKQPVSICKDISKQQIFKQMPLSISSNKTRPVLKIQDGCNSFCTYCIVPFARGKSRSMAMEKVIENIAQLDKSGFNEVVLSGVHLGRYGYDLSPNTSLTKLLYHIHKYRIIKRIRLSSIEPLELVDTIIDLVAKTDIFCNHFHIPLQSGDDTILKEMGRPYTSKQFKDLILKINQKIPDAAIGIDVLSGFPGETLSSFNKTLSFIKEIKVSYLHVFPFSPRKNTHAYNLPDKIDPQIIKKRCRQIRILGNSKKKKFYNKFVNKQVKILIESKTDKQTGFLKGITSNYIPVMVAGDDSKKNCFVNAKINKVEDINLVFGTIV